MVDEALDNLQYIAGYSCLIAYMICIDSFNSLTYTFRSRLGLYVLKIHDCVDDNVS